MFRTRNLHHFSFWKGSTKTAYQILGVERKATPQQIKLAYFELVKKVHPDQNKSPTAEDEFKEIVKAYETLKDPVKRQIYDLGASQDGFDINQSGTGHNAGGGSGDSGYYDSSAKKEFWQNRWYGYKKP